MVPLGLSRVDLYEVQDCQLPNPDAQLHRLDYLCSWSARVVEAVVAEPCLAQ